MAKNILPIIVVITLAIFAVRQLLAPGLPPTHDGEYHIIRFYEFNKALQSGEWYPRWAPDLNKGYGIPLFNYVYPLPNYVAALLHFFGISFIDVFKLNMLIATIVGAVFMYLWTRQFWGDWASIISSVAYTYSPYHFLDIYIRGSVGEVWALGLFPAFLWSVTKLIKESKLFFLPIASMMLSLIIFSHNILALMFFPFGISYMLFLCLGVKNKRYLILNTSYVILFGLGLSAIFWLPAIFEQNFVKGLEVFDYTQHFVEPYQLIFPSWGSGFSSDPTTQGLSFQIGVANLVSLLIMICFMTIFRKKIASEVKINIFIIFWAFLAIILMLPISQPIWKLIPLMQYFQFPWRFLSLIILFCSFLAGSIVYFLRWKIIGVMFIFIIIILGSGYSVPAYYLLRDDNYYITRSNFIDGTNSPGNVFNTIWFNKSLSKTSLRIEKMGQLVKVNTAYFPGWQGFVDGKRVKTEMNKDGLIQFWAPPGQHKIEVEFLDTPARSLAKIISLMSFIVLSILFIKYLRVKITE